MRLYRDAHGVIVGTQVEAKRMGKGWEQIDVPVDKPGLIYWLNNDHAVEVPANAERDAEFVERVATIHRPSYTEQSVSIDEEWDKLSLARQLHFAAVAMENARLSL